MEKLLTEIYTSFKEKISSPFFRYFGISWILWNYKFVYFIFFQNQEVFFKVHNTTKFDYLMNNPLFYENWYLSVLFCLILPILSALFFIYIFPKYNNKILKQYIKTLNEEYDEKQDRRKKIKLWDLEISKIILEEKQAETQIIEEKVKQKEVEKEKEIYQFDEWKKEYEEFKKSQAYSVFNNVIELINFYSWYFTSDRVPYRIQNNIVSYLLANKIIIKNDKRINYHLFTEKWEYFAKLYFEENNK
jgi:hypothetical protein